MLRSWGSQTDPYYGAPVIVLVLADGSVWDFCGGRPSCVLENMMLAAHALGLGTVWIHRNEKFLTVKAERRSLREWGLPETLRGVGAIALGYPSAPIGAAAQRKTDYIVRV